MKRTSREVIEKIVDQGLLNRGSYVITGFSGGPDSLCLLHALNELAAAMELVLIPVHINHKLRAEADAEQEHVIELCERMDLECMVYETDCRQCAEENGLTLEEAGRIIRYQIFDEVAADLESKGIPRQSITIVTAHNADDQCETLLFRLMRGTGLGGMVGISESRTSDNGYRIVRPLINVSRAAIEDYISDNKLKPNIDSSNEDTTYTRNRIRHELIPFLEKNFNPNIKETLNRFSRIADEDNSILTDITYAECEKCVSFDDERPVAIIDLVYAVKLPLAILRRLVGVAFDVAGLREDAGYQVVALVIDLMYSENPSARVNLPGGYIARREYDSLIIEPGHEEAARGIPEGIMMMPQIMMKKEFEHHRSELHAAFDFDEFNKVYPGKVGEIVLRTRQPGDFIAISGGKSKKIQDLLVDVKVPAAERDSVMLVAIGSEVLWVVPNEHMNTPQLRAHGKFSQNYQITNTTSRVLFLELTASL